MGRPWCEGRDVLLLEVRAAHGAAVGRLVDVVEEDVNRVVAGLVLETQVAHPRPLPIVGADREMETVERRCRRSPDLERRLEVLIARLRGRVGKTRRERLIAERTARLCVGNLECLAARNSDDVCVVTAGIRPAALAVDVAGDVRR